jgi:hypothetical protein
MPLLGGRLIEKGIYYVNGLCAIQILYMPGGAYMPVYTVILKSKHENIEFVAGC